MEETRYAAATRVDEAEPSATARMPMPAALPNIDAGQAIGRYVVLDRLGAGGMGVVYRAYDPQLHREVALKCLRPDAVEGEARARLVREARAMAKLNHPNVVTVHDIVVEGDEITLAMELVPGSTLAQWLETPRTPRAIVDALVEAGRGLAVAHRAGLVHRDFKPANVLVASDGRIKVGDFGLVKGLHDTEPEPWGGEVTDASLSDDLTGTKLAVGTPRFMAPEQHAAAAADARTDQFSFCVTLWWALVGAPPYAGGTVQDLLLAKLDGPPGLPSKVDVPPRIVRALRRGMAAAPEERWPSMEALLELLEPRPRRWLHATVAGLILAGASVAAYASLDRGPAPCDGAVDAIDELWSEQTRERISTSFEAVEVGYAQETWSRLEPELDVYAQHWRAQRADACEAVFVRGQETSTQMDLRVGCLEDALGSLAAALSVLEGIDAATLPQAHQVVADLPNLDRCGDTEELVRSFRPIASGRGDEQWHALNRRTAELEALAAAARHDDAIALGRELWASTADLRDGRLQARIGMAYGGTLAQRDLDGGIEVLGTSLERALASAPERETALLAFSLAYLLADQAKRAGEALWLARMGAGIVERMGSPPSLRAKAADSLGGVFRQLGRWEEAELVEREALELRRAALGDDHPDVAVSRNNLGLLLYHLSRPEEGIEHLEQALAIWREHLGDEHPEVGRARNNLAMVLDLADRLDEAEHQYRESLRIRSNAYGPEHRLTVATRHNLAIVLWERGKLELAHAELVIILRQWSQSLSPDHPNLAVAHNTLGLVLRDLERLDEAEREFRTAVELGERALGVEHPQLCQFWNNLAGVLIRRHAEDEARSVLERSLALAEAKLGADHPATKTAVELLEGLGEEGLR